VLFVVNRDEGIITPWIMFRYVVIGSYVGFATVGIFIYWYTSYSWAGDGHQLINLTSLMNWSECPGWTDFHVAGYQPGADSCNYFLSGRAKASTLSLTVLVLIEMFNAVNALSEDQSILTVGIFSNPYLIIACSLSVLLHCVIVYIPFFSHIFSVTFLSLNDWILVVAFSLPVFLIDEIIKTYARGVNAERLRKLNA
jgi:Ca2+-transporting ATPase